MALPSGGHFGAFAADSPEFEDALRPQIEFLRSLDTTSPARLLYLHFFIMQTSMFAAILEISWNVTGSKARVPCVDLKK